MVLPDITPASFAKVFTPQQAARIIWRSIMFRNMGGDPEYRKIFDELEKRDAGHQWFCYCLDAVARRAKIHDE